MEKTISSYIRSNVSNARLKKFLMSLISSTEVNEKLLCLCILIDLKYDLLKEDDYSEVCKEGKSCCTADYETLMPKVFSNYHKENTSYSRVVPLESFKTRMGSFKNESIWIDRDKIEKNGWSSADGIVWITLRKEIEEIIENSKGNEFSANDVCDFVGFARDYNRIATSSPRTQSKEFVVVHYSDNFNDCVFQANSSNADWAFLSTLFICYDKKDGFGRTYNENGIRFGKERIHRTSYYFDDKFVPVRIGSASQETLTRDGILDEASDRLGL
jgi:hypothetical protein